MAESPHPMLPPPPPKATPVVSRNETVAMCHAMQAFGGSFVHALAAAWLLADDENRSRLERAFPDYVKKYLHIVALQQQHKNRFY